MNNNNQVLDVTYYELAQRAYDDDETLQGKVVLKDSDKNLIQEWKVEKHSTTNKPEWTQ